MRSRNPHGCFGKKICYFTLVLIALVTMSAYVGAQPQESEPPRAISNGAMLPKIVAAKRVFLLIATPSSAASGFFGPVTVERVPAYEELEKAVRKWNKFAIVSDVSKADLVLLVVEWEDFHRWGRTVACRDWLLVFDGGMLPTEKSQPLWQGDREQWGKWGGCSGAGQPVKELRKAIEQAEKSAGRG